MNLLRIFPEMCARTRWSFASATRNMVPGSTVVIDAKRAGRTVTSGAKRAGSTVMSDGKPAVTGVTTDAKSAPKGVNSGAGRLRPHQTHQTRRISADRPQREGPT